MARFLRFLAAFFLLPLVWALCRTCVDVFALMPSPETAFFSREALALVCGMAVFLVVWMAAPAPVKAYVFGHELTHALWGLLFGARVSNLRVRENGGSVELSKSNVWITLAPYFFPFYTMVVVAAALATRCFVRPLPWPWAWTFAVGFTWCFHCCFTLKSLAQRQPDVQEYGRFFSWTFIFICNAVGVLAWIACTTELTFGVLGGRLFDRAVSAYSATGTFVVESVRSLPFLQK
ncbi:MAG: hypothetical protein MJ138_05235 [Kiritimatiellae bacterium]|nr:hypothetical protein [Kiritimatiellia bacterium]